jgi:hypothetical protein
MSFQLFRERPVDGGIPVSLSEARAISGMVVYLPTDARADRNSVDKIWSTDPSLGSNWPQTAITFESGLVIVEERPQFPDAQSEFEGLIAESLRGVDARVAEVAGIAALVIEPNSDANGENPGSVQVVVGDSSPNALDGTSVTIYGDGVSGTDLMEVLATLAISP